jgi:hypothetical protein
MSRTATGQNRTQNEFAFGLKQGQSRGARVGDKGSESASAAADEGLRRRHPDSAELTYRHGVVIFMAAGARKAGANGTVHAG